jgi:MinD-like ATPase involved in chromosome partitioning or flagellar assembly
MANEQDNSADIVRSCAISQDLESYPLLIQEMQTLFGESWGGLEIEDAISVLNSSHAEHMESLVMAVGSKDEQNIDLIVEIIKNAKSKSLRTVLVTKDLSASALHSLMRSGADDFVPYPLPHGALTASLATEPVSAGDIQPEPTAPAAEPAPVVQQEAPEEPVSDSITTPEAPVVTESVSHNFVQSQRAEVAETVAEPVLQVMPAPEEPAKAGPSQVEPEKAPEVAAVAPPVEVPAAPVAEAPAAPIEEPAAPSPETPASPAVSTTVKSGTVFPVYGMAGGVGTSTFAANLAWELQSVLGTDGRVCLLDFGFQFGSVGTYLDTPRTDITLDLFSSIDIADAEAFTQSLSMYKDTLAILPAPPEAVPLDIMNPSQINKLIELASSQFDYVIIDLPNTLMSWTETILDKSHLMFALLEMDMRSAQNALRFLRALKADDLPYEKVQFILNRAPKRTDLNGGTRVKRMAESLNIEFRWKLPDGGKHIVNACDQGLPLAETAARNPMRKDLRKIAENLVALSDDKSKIKARA